MLKNTLQFARNIYSYLRLPQAAKASFRRDLQGLAVEDPGVDAAIEEGIKWLCRAQDHSLSQDGGVARHYSLIGGWSSSYPETTGYIIPTVLSHAASRNDESLRQRARRMLDWLVFIQLPEGGFQGGLIDSKPVVPVTFNTGQILIGLSAGAAEFGEKYREAMCRAADWLVQTQDGDGCWRRHPTPFAAQGEKAYETHVAWGLLEATRVEPDKGYAEAAISNVRWALKLQKPNGWFEKCCLADPSRPLTHTLGYVLRGIIEAYRFTSEDFLLSASVRTADGLLKAIRLKDGFLAGRLDADWQPAVTWACLTGSVQIAYCWLLLYRYTGEKKYLNAAQSANCYVRRTMNVNGPAETRGAIKGSFPVNGLYGAYEYLNWACKFFIDSNRLEKSIMRGTD